MGSRGDQILVIRTGALGDLVFCLQGFHEIRLAHPDARLALLTRRAYVEFARAMPWFDEILVDPRPGWKEPLRWAALVREVRAFAPSRIYDLQGKTRQSVLYALLGGPFGQPWSGAAPFCAFPRPWPPHRPPRADAHFTDFLAAQLRAAGVPAANPAALDWLDADTRRFALPDAYAAIVPGCSPGAPHKRWPAARYGELARVFAARGLGCAAVGAGDDYAVVAEVAAAGPIVNLVGRTSVVELAGVLRRAVCVVGNDTGPVHLAAAIGAPTLALLSARTNSAWSRPPGKIVQIRQSAMIETLSLETAVTAVEALFSEAASVKIKC